MNDRICQGLEELLVEHADGELPSDQARPLAEHLAVCRACRERLEALQTSLELARDIWQDAAASVGPIDIQPASRKRSLVLKRSAVAVACAVLAGGAALYVWMVRPRTGPGVGPAPSFSAEQVARIIRREGASARLAASAQILAEQPGGREYAARAFRYVTEAYPDTVAGKAAKNKDSFK